MNIPAARLGAPYSKCDGLQCLYLLFSRELPRRKSVQWLPSNGQGQVDKRSGN